MVVRWEGSAMLRRSPRRILEAIITQAVALIVALAGSDLKLSVTKQGQSKSIELPGRHDISLLHAREVAAFSRARWQLSRARGGSADKKKRRRSRPPQRKPGVRDTSEPRGVAPKSKHRMTEAGGD